MGDQETPQRSWCPNEPPAAVADLKDGQSTTSNWVMSPEHSHPHHPTQRFTRFVEGSFFFVQYNICVYCICVSVFKHLKTIYVWPFVACFEPSSGLTRPFWPPVTLPSSRLIVPLYAGYSSLVDREAERPLDLHSSPSVGWFFSFIVWTCLASISTNEWST